MTKYCKNTYPQVLQYNIYEKSASLNRSKVLFVEQGETADRKIRCTSETPVLLHPNKRRHYLHFVPK